MSFCEVVMYFYLSVSVVTLAVYAWDKQASKRTGARRVRERTLHAWALLGGFAGAWIGQIWLRHKTRHPSFVFVNVVATVLHVGAWAWWWSGR